MSHPCDFDEECIVFVPREKYKSLANYGDCLCIEIPASCLHEYDPNETVVDELDE